MKVQVKILLLLLVIVATFIGGLVALKRLEQQKFKAIADARATDRYRIFQEFLEERGDNLEVVVEDSSVLDDMVRAIVKEDVPWVEEYISDEMLATFKANAIWVCRPDGTLFFSRNNRYADNLINIPIPARAFESLFSEKRVCHFWVKVPQGWMEVRGATVHPSRDRDRETKPQGYLFAGHIWIDESVRRMALFTGYEIRIVSGTDMREQPPSEEERGLISFSRVLVGWDGRPVAQIQVRHDSPIIRELNRASERLFQWLIVFAAVLFLLVSVSLIQWVRRPLRLLSRSLENAEPAGLEALSREQNEFGRLAELIVASRRTEEALYKTEEQLRHSQKLEAVGRLAGGIAHDFNNLLTAIIGYSELLESRLVNDGTSREHAQLIRQAGERAAQLTRQLLAFSRKQLLQPRVIDLNALVHEMEKLLQRIIGEHIRIAIQPAATDARVCADPTQVEQVILNLGVNARDAMPRGGTLSIRTSNETLDAAAIEARALEAPIGEYIVLSVSDTGAGMTEETRAHIFEPFFTTKGPGKGTGLGLATVYGIVKQSGGSITVDSEIDRGSTFRIYLPRAEAPIEPPKSIAPPPERSQHAEMIMVCEDEEFVRTLVCALLSEAGYKVLCAGSPTEALEVIQKHAGEIDLLVTDVVMPEMHGPALAHAAAPFQPMMKVLYVSGYSDKDISDQGVVSAGLEVLQKPFTQQSLIRKVREILDEQPVVA